MYSAGEVPKDVSEEVTGMDQYPTGILEGHLEREYFREIDAPNVVYPSCLHLRKVIFCVPL